VEILLEQTQKVATMVVATPWCSHPGRFWSLCPWRSQPGKALSNLIWPWNMSLPWEEVGPGHLHRSSLV